MEMAGQKIRRDWENGLGCLVCKVGSTAGNVDGVSFNQSERVRIKNTQFCGFGRKIGCFFCKRLVVRCYLWRWRDLFLTLQMQLYQCFR